MFSTASAMPLACAPIPPEPPFMPLQRARRVGHQQQQCAGILYEQLSFDVFNGIGNAFGLRTNPTGAALYATSACPTGVTPAAAVCQIPSPGNIGVTNISFTGAALTSQTTPGAIAYDWINNGPSQSL